MRKTGTKTEDRVVIDDTTICYYATVDDNTHIIVTASLTGHPDHPASIVFRLQSRKGLFARIKESMLTLCGYGSTVTIHLDQKICEALKKDVHNRLVQQAASQRP